MGKNTDAQIKMYIERKESPVYLQILQYYFAIFSTNETCLFFPLVFDL
jgi:hypothetical protein